MRIAFVGKGGSGKTTVTSLFATQMAVLKHKVLALDADINQHLPEALKVTEKLPNMGEKIDEIKNYLVGDNPLLDSEAMQKTTPPGKGSRLINLKDDDWFIKNFAVKSPDGAWVAGAGEIPEGNVGVRCYHGLNGSIELVLGHLVDGKSDIVIVDMTAGADAFSSSLFTKMDALVLVVEPTVKSLSVYQQFLHHLKPYSIPLLVVANKVVDEADLDFIKKTVKNLVAVMPSSGYIKKRDRGEAVSRNDMENEVVESLNSIYKTVEKIDRNWDELHKRSVDMHLKNAESWMGENAKKQIDSNFSMADVAKQML